MIKKALKGALIGMAISCAIILGIAGLLNLLLYSPALAILAVVIVGGGTLGAAGATDGFRKY